MTQASPGLTGVLETALETADLLAAHADTELSNHVRSQAAAERRARLGAAWDGALADNAAVSAAQAVSDEIWAAWRPQGELTSAYRTWQTGRGEAAPDQPISALAILVTDVRLTNPAIPFFHNARPGFDLKPAIVDAANTGYRHPGIADLHQVAVAALAATGERVAEIGLDHLEPISEWALWQISGGALDPVFLAWREEWLADYRPPAAAVASTIPTPIVRPDPPRSAAVIRNAPGTLGSTGALLVEPPRPEDGVTGVEVTYRVQVTTIAGTLIPGTTTVRRITDGSDCPAATGGATLTESTEETTETTTRTTCVITTAEIPAKGPSTRSHVVSGSGPCPAPRPGETLTGDDLRSSGSSTTRCVYTTREIPGTPGRRASTRTDTTTGAACPAPGADEELTGSELQTRYHWTCTVVTRGRSARRWTTGVAGFCPLSSGSGQLVESSTQYTCRYSQTGIGTYQEVRSTPCPQSGDRPRATLTRQTVRSSCTYAIQSIPDRSDVTTGTAISDAALRYARERCESSGSGSQRFSTLGFTTVRTRYCYYATPAVEPTPTIPARSRTEIVAGGASNCPAAGAGESLTPYTTSTTTQTRSCVYTKAGSPRVPGKEETVVVSGDSDSCPAAKQGQTVQATPSVTSETQTTKVCSYTTQDRVDTVGGTRDLTFASQPVDYPTTSAGWDNLLNLDVFQESGRAGLAQIRFVNAAGASGDLVVPVDASPVVVERAVRPVWGAQGTARVLVGGMQFRKDGGYRSVRFELWELSATPAQIGSTATLLPTSPTARIAIPLSVRNRRNEIEARYSTTTGTRIATFRLPAIPRPWPTDIQVRV